MGDKNTFTVLVMDDDTDVLEMIELGLSRIKEMELITSFASDGAEGLKLCTQFEFDAVITDYFMPNMDGIEFIKKFRKIEMYKSTPIIFTTGYFSELDFKKNEHLFEDVIFLEKPYQFSKMASFLKIYLEGPELKSGSKST